MDTAIVPTNARVSRTSCPIFFCGMVLSSAYWVMSGPRSPDIAANTLSTRAVIILPLYFLIYTKERFRWAKSNGVSRTSSTS